MIKSFKRYFNYLFIIYYITYDYKFIIIVNYIWLWIQSYKIYIIKIKKLIVKLLVKDRKVWILISVYVL